MALFRREERGGGQRQTDHDPGPDSGQPGFEGSSEIGTASPEEEKPEGCCEGGELAGVAFDVQDEVVDVAAGWDCDYEEGGDVVDY